MRHPEADIEARLLGLAALRLGAETYRAAYGSPAGYQRGHRMSTLDPVRLALHLATVFDRLRIRCAVGGSLASSVFGEPRATEDVDFVADVRLHDVAPLVEALRDEFYVDEAAVRRAVERRSSFNLINLASARKVDVFVPSADALYGRQLTHSRTVRVSDTPGDDLPMLSPEDVVLQKLAWYRKTGEASERQWRDVLGILKVQGDRLDWKDLLDVADAAGLRTLLDRARAEATGHE